MNIPLNTVIRFLLVTGGTLSLFLGILGIFLPLLPTVPFLLLTAWCYAKASPRLYGRILRYAWFRYYIRSYQEGRGVPIRVKMTSIGLLWVSGMISVMFLLDLWILRFGLVIVIVMVTYHILKIPTARNQDHKKIRSDSSETDR